MRFQGSLIEEQGVTFGVVVVRHEVLSNRAEANRLIEAFGTQIFHAPVVLMAQDSRGVPSYYGRRDIARFMANVPIQAIPWKEYTLR